MKVWVLVLAAVLLGATLRLARVERDLPREVEATSAPTEDAFWHLEAAQGGRDGSALEPLSDYDRPAWVAVARLWFKVAPTGIAGSHALAAVLGTLQVAFVALALRPLGPRGVLAGTLLLAVSYPFVALSRTPIIYGPIATGLAAAWAFQSSERWWLRLAGAGLVAALALGFKGVAAVALPGFALGEVARHGLAGRTVRVAGRDLDVLGLILVVGVPVLVALGAWDPTGTVHHNLERIRVYLGGDDPNVTASSILASAPRNIVLVLAESGFAPLAPGLVGLALAGTLRRSDPGARALVATAVGWLVPLLVLLALLNYRPLRYFALAGPPLAVLGAAALSPHFPRGEARPRLLRAFVLAVLAANAVHLGCKLVGAKLLLQGASTFALSGAAVVAALALFRKRFGRVPISALTLLAAATVALDLARDASLLVADDSLVRANAAARAALGPRAVLAGPDASFLAAGSPLERHRAPHLHAGHLSKEGIAFAASRGFTHVALTLDADLRGDFSNGFAREGEKPVLVAALTVRNDTILLYRLARAPGYELSPFERGLETPPVLVGARARAARALVLLDRRDEAVALLRSLPPDDVR